MLIKKLPEYDLEVHRLDYKNGKPASYQIYYKNEMIWQCTYFSKPPVDPKTGQRGIYLYNEVWEKVKDLQDKMDKLTAL